MSVDFERTHAYYIRGTLAWEGQMNILSTMLASITDDDVAAFEAGLSATGRGTFLGVIDDAEFRRLLTLEISLIEAVVDIDERIEEAVRPSWKMLREKRTAYTEHDLVWSAIVVHVNRQFGNRISDDQWGSDTLCWEVSSGWRFWIYHSADNEEVAGDDIPADHLQDILEAADAKRKGKLQ